MKLHPTKRKALQKKSLKSCLISIFKEIFTSIINSSGNILSTIIGSMLTVYVMFSIFNSESMQKKTDSNYITKTAGFGAVIQDLITVEKDLYKRNINCYSPGNKNRANSLYLLHNQYLDDLVLLNSDIDRYIILENKEMWENLKNDHRNLVQKLITNDNIFELCSKDNQKTFNPDDFEKIRHKFKAEIWKKSDKLNSEKDKNY